MGTEILPQILHIIQFFCISIGAIAFIVAIFNFAKHARIKNPEVRAETKKRLLDALITLLLALIVYFALSSIGPLFQILF